MKSSSGLPALALAVMYGALLGVRSEVGSLAQPSLTATSLAAIISEAQRVAVPVKALSEAPHKNLTAGLQLPDITKTGNRSADWSSLYNFTNQAVKEQIGQSSTNPRANSWRCRGSTPLAAVPFCGLPFAATNSYGKSPRMHHHEYVPVELLTIMSLPYTKSDDASKLEGAAITAKQASLALASHLPAAGM